MRAVAMAPTRSSKLFHCLSPSFSHSLFAYNDLDALNSPSPLMMKRARSKTRKLLHSSPDTLSPCKGARPIVSGGNAPGQLPGQFGCARRTERVGSALRRAALAENPKSKSESRTGGRERVCLWSSGAHRRMNHVTYCRGAQRPARRPCRVSSAWPATDSRARVKTGAGRGESKRNPRNSSSFS